MNGKLYFIQVLLVPQSMMHAYVIDGLLHNEDLVSDRHSTDTHGYTEAVFALSHFIGVDFSPRIKSLASQTLSVLGIRMRRQFKGKGYKILPSHVIDDILRLMTIIILRGTKISIILKRFNSYEEKNVFYDALQEFGKIIKSLFILKYIDDVKLRQAIQKQLNRGELDNKFSMLSSFQKTVNYHKSLVKNKELP